MKRILLIAVLAAFSLPLRAEGKSKFGHRPYKEAPRADLKDAGKYRDTGRVVQMRTAAARAFQDMAAAARAEGVEIIPISGFRPVKYQRGLFSRAVKKHGSEEAAARWVAPPGHSEHHTGWTLDLGDASRPDTDVDTSFETTKASSWLKQNAARFGFELSFPKDNPQGVSYEPWHWRFIGADEARKTFHPE